MANIQWNAQNFTPVKFNPSAGFAAAADSFGAISKNIQAQKEADSLAAARIAETELDQQRQAFIEAAPERKIAEEQRLLEQSAEQGILAQALAESSGGSRTDKLFADITGAADPRFQELSGLAPGQSGPMEQAGFEAIDEFAAANQAAVSDPKTYRKTLLTGLLDSKQFKREDAESIADAETQRLFPTIDSDQQKIMLDALKGAPGIGGSGTGGTGRGGSGTFKPWSQMPSVMDETKIHNEFMDRYPVSKGEDFTLFGKEIFDWTGPGGAEDITGPDIRKLSTTMKQEGVNPAATYAVLEKYIQGNNLDFDPTNMTPDQKASFKAEAQLVMDQQQGGYNSKTGGMIDPTVAQQGAQKDYFNAVDEILGYGSFDKLTDDELANQFLSGLGEAAPAQQVAPAPKAAPIPVPQTDGIMPPVAAQVQAPAPAVQPAGIMPVEQAPVPQGVNNLGIELADIPESEGSKLFTNLMDTVKGTAAGVPDVIARGLASLQNLKDESYGKQTKAVTDAIRNNGSLDGISGSDIKVALASRKLSPHEKAVIRKLSDIRKR